MKIRDAVTNTKNLGQHTNKLLNYTKNKQKEPKPGLVTSYDLRPKNGEGLFWKVRDKYAGKVSKHTNNTTTRIHAYIVLKSTGKSRVH